VCQRRKNGFYGVQNDTVTSSENEFRVQLVVGVGVGTMRNLSIHSLYSSERPNSWVSDSVLQAQTEPSKPLHRTCDDNNLNLPSNGRT
jgi:hypothetical protein